MEVFYPDVCLLCGMKIPIAIRIMLQACLLHGRATAQRPVPSEKERHHKVVFENRYIRILEGRVAARDTTPEHTHSANAVVVFLSRTTFGIRSAGQEPVLAHVQGGDLRYVDYGDKPVSHIVWDAGPSPLRFLVIELKRRTGDSCQTPAIAGLHLQWRRPIVTAYDWNMAGGRPLRFPARQCAWVLIDITRGGRYYFFWPGTDVRAGESGRYILLQL